MFRSVKLNLLLGLVAAGVIGSSVFAFTATNTLPANTYAGDGSVAISGFTISSIDYTLNATTPTNLDAVTFTIAPTSASTVKVRLAAAGSWYSCTNTAGSVSCATTSPQATVSGATQLTVVAAD